MLRLGLVLVLIALVDVVWSFYEEHGNDTARLRTGTAADLSDHPSLRRRSRPRLMPFEYARQSTVPDGARSTPASHSLRSPPTSPR